jgi:Pep3/Vps18/deep orange family
MTPQDKSPQHGSFTTSAVELNTLLLSSQYKLIFHLNQPSHRTTMSIRGTSVGSTNPFDDRTTRRSKTREPSIWAARHVEWPLPTSLTTSQFQKLTKTSQSQQESTADNDEAYSGLTGFMSRVLNTSANTETAIQEDAEMLVRPPTCVAAANGWIVASLESTQGLRLVSRWNVRRGSLADQWLALPVGDAKIMHVLVDPTASHVVLSAANGDLYYVVNKSIVKLAGFGMNPDSVSHITGVPATSVAYKSPEEATIQTGLTPGSYVTCIAWDKERGTEGSTKRILLGTSIGEIYEYTLVSPQCEDPDEKAAASVPILLHRLVDGQQTEEASAPITGLYMERLRTTGWIILCATSGRNKRTRLYTFTSLHEQSLRMVLANQQQTHIMELPGSIASAELRVCNDHFALLTETGLFYGTIDRSLTSAMAGGTSVIVDSGILPYTNSITGEAGTPPISLALTPHHWILLNEANEIQFINRIVHKVVQKERVESPTSAVDDMHTGSLLMDIRRPDQVWYRRGRSLIHISSSQEDRDIWKYTLQKCLKPSKMYKSAAAAAAPPPGRSSGGLFDRLGLPDLTDEEKSQEAMFEQAKSLCQTSAQKAVVTTVRAEYHLSQGRAALAAKYFAQAPSSLEPFADTAIRLALPRLGIDDPTSYGGSETARTSLESSNIPTITYLLDKMRLGRMNDDRMTCTMIGAWLTELYLHERGEKSTSLSIKPETMSKEDEAAHRALLAQFLSANVSNMDSKTIMKILSSHDVGAAECASYAAKSGDISTAVNSALCIGVKDSVSDMQQSADSDCGVCVCLLTPYVDVV